MDLIERKVIFLFSPQVWGSMLLSKHHYAMELAEMGAQVFFLEPARKGGKELIVTRVSDNLKVVNYPLLARGRGKLPRWIYNLLVKKEVNLLIENLKVKPNIVWCFDPFKLEHLRYFGNSIKIYHPVDRFDPGCLNTSLRIDHCFSTMPSEIQALRKMGFVAEFINHGLSNTFAAYSEKRLQEAAITSNNEKVNVGYSGNLGAQALDRITMRKVIQQNPECLFHFWGQAEKEVSYIDTGFNDQGFVEFLKDQPNVKLYGVVSTEELALGFQQMDIFWLCWDITADPAWSAQTNPHKVMEYLSTGKPVISHLIELYKESEMLTMCSSINNSEYPDLFRAEVLRCRQMNEQLFSLMDSRLKFALENTYRKQVLKIKNFLSGSTVV